MRKPLNYEDLPGERWRPVVGWEGFYEVSDLGRIRSIDRTVVHNTRGGRPVPHRYKGPASEAGVA